MAAVGVSLAAGIWALRAGPLSGNDHGHRPFPAQDPGAAGVAAAYGYPSRCVTVTIPLRHPAYARADFDREASCGRYDGYATAIFHRRAGAWRPVLDAVGYSCPVRALPEPVQAELDVCLNHSASAVLNLAK